MSISKGFVTDGFEYLIDDSSITIFPHNNTEWEEKGYKMIDKISGSSFYAIYECSGEIFKPILDVDTLIFNGDEMEFIVVHEKGPHREEIKSAVYLDYLIRGDLRSESSPVYPVVNNWTWKMNYNNNEYQEMEIIFESKRTFFYLSDLDGESLVTDTISVYKNNRNEDGIISIGKNTNISDENDQTDLFGPFIQQANEIYSCVQELCKNKFNKQ